ncbi:hypothetical protein Bca52824_032636 [Brassica carinata]|uniref:Uncharacterized protein n=1 Tax=Brassica carinata TaxID=52824 RepID=A0A8X7SEJ9_BRACI|nr:hypothetical protein Bca52824_032636 [Brassica carinata]
MNYATPFWCHHRRHALECPKRLNYDAIHARTNHPNEQTQGTTQPEKTPEVRANPPNPQIPEGNPPNNDLVTVIRSLAEK